MKLVFSSDHAGFALKRHLMEYLADQGCECEDLGAASAEEPASYVPYAARAAEAAASGRADFGIVVCGTGIGVSIAANKVKGARCALPVNEYMARMAREHNNANVLALGARVLGTQLAESICDAFLGGVFEKGGRHEARITEITELETSFAG